MTTSRVSRHFLKLLLDGKPIAIMGASTGPLRPVQAVQAFVFELFPAKSGRAKKNKTCAKLSLLGRRVKIFDQFLFQVPQALGQ
jgi:hypothetical protein